MAGPYTWTNPTVNFINGNTYSVTEENNRGNDLLFLYANPYYLAFNSVTTALAGGPIQITLGGVEASNYGITIAANNLTIATAGIYEASWMITLNSNVDTTVLSSKLYHNGAEVRNNTQSNGTANNNAAGGSCLLSCAAADTVAIYATCAAVGSTTLIGSNHTFLHLIYRSAA